MAVELSQVQAQVADLGLDWQPGETVNSSLGLLRARSRTGAVPPAGQRTLQARVAAAATAPVARAAVSGLPASVDWRDKAGDWVTPVRDQQYCGSCVAFGTVAVLESMVRITAKSPSLAVDLSEAHLFFCYGADTGAGACPDGGWWPDDAFASLKTGVVDEACFPYTDADQKCRLGADWQNRLTTATTYAVLDTAAKMKRHLATVGPLAACFTTYEDFSYYYTGGVYRYHEKTSGDEVGGHCVCIVGYDDHQHCWIAKNSWGRNWGEHGFFRIGYGECGIDASMWGVTGTVRSPLLSALAVITVSDGGLRYTVRTPGADWPSESEPVVTPPAAEAFTTVRSSGVGPRLHVVGLAGQGAHGNLWHSIRGPAGQWQAAFGNVADPGRTRTLTAVDCAATGADLHVLGLDSGHLVHTTRRGNHTWQARFGTVPLPAGAGTATAVAAAGIGGDLHVLVVAAGRVWHTFRNAQGDWSPAFDAVPAPPDVVFTGVACAGVNGALQVVGLAEGGPHGNLWHSIRDVKGHWQAAFGNVRAAGRTFTAVSCAGIGGDLQLVGLVDGAGWQTVRYATGKWPPAFTPVPVGGSVTALDCAALR